MHSRIDATEETNRLGRLIGHKHTQDSPNLVSKCFMENGIPRLIFLAACNIKSGDELLYDYGDREKSTVQELPWLLPAGDQPKTVPPVPLAQSPAPVAPPQTSFKTPTTRTKHQVRKKLFGMGEQSSSAGSQTDLSLTEMSEELQEELQLYSQLQSEPGTPGRLDSLSQSQVQIPGTPYQLSRSQSIPMTPATPGTPLVYRSANDLVSEYAILNKDLLKDKIYYVLGKIQKETKQILEFGGAKKHRILSNSVHYIILGENPDLDELDEAYHLGTVDDPTVVKENWVWYSMITGKKLPTEPFSHYEKILDGVVALLGEMSLGDKNKVWAMLTWHGAQVVNSLTSVVTHVIENKPEGQLYMDASSQPNISIVTSDWVQQTAKSRLRCDEKEYHPSLFGDQYTELLTSPTIDAPQPAQKKTIDERSPQKDPEAKRLKTTLEAPQDQGLGEVAQQKTLHERSPPKDLPPKKLKTTLGTEDVQQESQSSGSVEKDLEKLNLDGKLRINYKKLINCQHIIV